MYTQLEKSCKSKSPLCPIVQKKVTKKDVNDNGKLLSNNTIQNKYSSIKTNGYLIKSPHSGKVPPLQLMKSNIGGIMYNVELGGEFKQVHLVPRKQFIDDAYLKQCVINLEKSKNTFVLDLFLDSANLRYSPANIHLPYNFAATSSAVNTKTLDSSGNISEGTVLFYGYKNDADRSILLTHVETV